MIELERKDFLIKRRASEEHQFPVTPETPLVIELSGGTMSSLASAIEAVLGWEDAPVPMHVARANVAQFLIALQRFHG